MKLSGIFPLALSSVFPASAMAEPSSLEPMTILATRSEKSSFETAGSDAVLTYDELSRQGSTTLGSALKYVPGVSVPFDFTGADPLVPYLGGGEKSINIRGMEGNRISISLDGIRQPQEFFVAGGMAGPGRVYFDPATLSQLELYKSASSSLYGNESMGGSLNGRTVSPIALLGEEILGSAGSNELTYTSVNRSFGNRLTAGQGNGIWAVSAVYSYREGHERINNSSIPSDPQEFDSHALVFKTLRKGNLLDMEGTIDLFDQYTFTDVNSIEGADPMNDVASYVGHKSNRERQRFSLEAKLSTEEELDFADELSVLAYVQESAQSSVNSQNRLDHIENRLRKISFQTDLLGLNLKISKFLELDESSHRIEMGADFAESDISTKYLQWETFKDTTKDPSFSDKNSMAPSEARELGIYLQDEIEIESLPEWVFTPSLRMDKYKVTPTIDKAFMDNPSRKKFRFNPVDYENDPVFSPGLSIIRKMGAGTNLYATYNRGIRNPSAEELNGFFEHPATGDRPVIIRPNPELREEISDSFEVGAQAKLKSGSLTFAFFKNFYDDFINLEEQADPNLDVFANQNVGKVRIHGFEMALERKLGDWLDALNGFGAGFSTSWSRGKKVENAEPLNTIEPWQAVFFFDYEFEKEWGTRITGTHRSAKKTEDLDSTSGDVPIAGSLVVDWVGWLQINETFQLRAGLNNLTDEQYFLWSSARRGGGHVASSTEERNMQPGIHGFLSLRASF